VYLKSETIFLRALLGQQVPQDAVLAQFSRQIVVQILGMDSPKACSEKNTVISLSIEQNSL
jgi:hypothetical protein